MTTGSIFGLAEKALLLTEKRAQVLSSNLVNSTTPGYKAKDIDFTKVMKNELAQLKSQHPTLPNHPKHIPVTSSASQPELLYRVAMQHSRDGNTVDSDVEMAQFMENAIKYQASLTFANGTYQNLLKSIKGQ